MLAKDLMRKEVFTIRDEDSVEELIEMLVREHIHGAPVIDAAGTLVGVATQQDAFFSSVTLSRRSARAGRSSRDSNDSLRVRDIMTSPAVFATEDTDVGSLCRLMARLRIHRVPIVRENRVTGIVSSLDICGVVASGEYRP